jgi:hypothetical protein
MKKFITGLMCALSILFCLWFAASWIDIVADNCEPNPVHSEYNLFVLALENS